MFPKISYIGGLWLRSVLVSCASVTDYHKLGCLMQPKFILSQFWSADVQIQFQCVKSRCRHTSTLSECSRGKPVSCCFRFWRLPACLEHSTDSCILGRTVFSSSACVKSPSAFFLRIRVIAFRVQPYHPG